MLPDREPDNNDLNVDVLLDALTEMPEPGEPIYSSAWEWPDWTDDGRVWLGLAKRRAEAFNDLPDDDVGEIPF